MAYQLQIPFHIKTKMVTLGGLNVIARTGGG